MEEKYIINSILGVIGTIVSCLIGNWDNNMQILMLLIITDYITGLMKAYKSKELASDVGFKGLLRKVAIFFAIILAHQMDLISNTSAPIFKTMSIYFYIANEGLSIIENLGMLGVPLPRFIANVLKKIKQQNDNISNDNENLGDDVNEQKS